MKDNFTYTITTVFAFVFCLLAVVCLAGAVAAGAWWHIITAVICAAVAAALRKDAIGNEDDVDLE